MCVCGFFFVVVIFFFPDTCNQLNLIYGVVHFYVGSVCHAMQMEWDGAAPAADLTGIGIQFNDERHRSFA